jgi:hypothetical protein
MLDRSSSISDVVVGFIVVVGGVLACVIRKRLWKWAVGYWLCRCGMLPKIWDDWTAIAQRVRSVKWGVGVIG